ncbi:MAG: PorP/SprF family type IX secretion system membrane protein [Bacteroidales bacterium]|nr:PorP/SprF family type IX secretion system membrane protein [Bacteroidales bacterium]
MKRVNVKVSLIHMVFINGMLLGLSGLLQGQDIHTSRWWEIPMWVNYSEAGKFGGNYRLIMGYRTQWNTLMGKGYRTMTAMFDMPWGKEKEGFGGLGLLISRDEAGVVNFSKLVVNVGISYHVKVGEEGYLSGGLGGGAMEYNLDMDRVLFDSQFDGKVFNGSLPSGETIENNRIWLGDVGAGLSYRWGNDERMMVASNLNEGSKMLDMGVAMYHALRQRYHFLSGNTDHLSIRWVFHGLGLIGLRGTNAGLMPGLLFQYQAGAMEWVMVGRIRYILNEQSKFSNYSKGAALNFGVGYRLKESIIPMFELETGSFSLGLSYDVVLSNLATKGQPTGSFEFTLKYLNPNPFKSQSRFF